MGLTITARNKMLDHLVNEVPLYVGGLTSENGSDEILTGRKQITFTTAVGGVVVGNSAEPLVISLGTTITHVAIFDSDTGGELLGVFPLTTPETFSNEGSLNITGLSITLS